MPLGGGEGYSWQMNKVSHFNWNVKDVYNFILYASKSFCNKLEILINKENTKSYLISRYFTSYFNHKFTEAAGSLELFRPP